MKVTIDIPPLLFNAVAGALILNDKGDARIISRTMEKCQKMKRCNLELHDSDIRDLKIAVAAMVMAQVAHNMESKRKENGEKDNV